MHVDALAPLFIVLNPRSGKHGAGETRAAVEGVLQAAGRPYEIRQTDAPGMLEDTARRAVADAKARGGVVVVAGGDGTINTVAQAVLGSGCALGVLPQGTFNYFGRANGLTDDAAQATRDLLRATPQAVQVGLVNGQVFLVNASLGLYPRLLEDREAYKREYGRSRLVAVWSALVTLGTAHRPLRLKLQVQRKGHGQGQGQNAEGGDEIQRTVRTPTLFVGNNPLQLQQIGVPGAEDLAQGALVAITLQPVGTWKLLWLMLRGAFGQLGAAEDVRSVGFRRLEVRPTAPLGRRKVKVATDGEIHWLRAPLVFEVSPQPLWLMKAPAATAAAAAVAADGEAPA